MLLIASLLAQVAAVPLATRKAQAPTAEALGARLARSGSIMALLPIAAKKDTDELVAAHPELSPAEQHRLRATAKATFDAGVARIETASGPAYPRRFTIAELKELVAQAENPAQVRLRAAQPAVMVEALSAIGKLDLTVDVAAAFCRDTGKLCTK